MVVIIIITIVIIISCSILFIININALSATAFLHEAVEALVFGTEVGPLFSEQKWILFFISWNSVLRKTFVADLSPRPILVVFLSEIPS